MRTAGTTNGYYWHTQCIWLCKNYCMSIEHFRRNIYIHSRATHYTCSNSKNLQWIVGILNSLFRKISNCFKKFFAKCVTGWNDFFSFVFLGASFSFSPSNIESKNTSWSFLLRNLCSCARFLFRLVAHFFLCTPVADVDVVIEVVYIRNKCILVVFHTSELFLLSGPAIPWLNIRECIWNPHAYAETQTYKTKSAYLLKWRQVACRYIQLPLHAFVSFPFIPFGVCCFSI